MEIIRATKTAHQAGAYYVRIQAMLGRVVVLPECRNKGIGTFVVKEAEKWAKELGFHTAVMESRDNKIPMAFNLFCPLIQMLQDGKEELTTKIVQSIFPDFNIDKVTKVKLEYLHTKIENYLNDRTAMDAIIRYTDTEGLSCFIAIETKYTDVLGTNSATHTDKQKALIKELEYND